MRILPGSLCALLILSGCSSESFDEEIPLMGSVYESEFQEGFIGCEWVEQKPLKLNPPLSGWLYFSSMDCGDIGQPAYGYRKSFSLSEDNKLMVDGLPKPPKDHPHKLGGPSEIMALFDIGEMTETEFMTSYLSSNDPACKIGQTESGYWDIGYSRDYLESQGIKFPGYPENYSRVGFPMDDQGLGLCSQQLHAKWRYKVFRFQENIGFKYQHDLIEITKIIDPGSVIIRR